MSYEQYDTKNKGRLWAVWYRDTTNRLHRKAGFPTKSAAKAWEAENVTLPKRNGDWADPKGGRATVAALYPSWLDGKKGTHKPKYVNDLESAWRIHVGPKWGARRLDGIRRSEVQSWVSGLAASRSASVTIRAYGVLNGVFDMAVGDGLIRTSPCSDIELPRKTRKTRTYLTVRQLLALAAASGEHATLVLLLGFCGLRMGEARGLRVSDLDMKAGRLTVNRSVTRVNRAYVVSAPKTWERRTVPIPARVLARLAADCGKKDDDMLVFTGPRGYLGEYRHGAANWWSRAIKAAGVPPLTLHDLRHTAASIAISSGANVKAVQRMLGHKTAAMTLDTYADLFDSDLDAVAKKVDERIGETLEKMSSPMSSQVPETDDKQRENGGIPPKRRDG